MYITGVRSALLGLLCAVLFFTAVNMLIKLADHIPHVTIAFFRFGIGMALLGVLLLLRKVNLKVVNARLLLLRGLLGGSAVIIFYITLQKIGIATGVLLGYTFPIFSTIGGVIFLKQFVDGKRIAAIAGALSGIALMVLPHEYSWSGALGWHLIAVLGAMLGGMAVVTIKKLRETDDSSIIFFAQCVIGFALVAIPAGSTSATALGWQDGVLLLGIGLAAALGQLLYTHAFRFVDVAAGSLMGLLVPVLSIQIGVFVFNETITPRKAMGMVVVLIACGCMAYWQGAEKRRESALAEVPANACTNSCRERG